MAVSSAPVRFAFEAAALVAVGVALAAADVGLAAFAAVMALAWIALAAVERTLLRPDRGMRSQTEAEAGEPLPLHLIDPDRAAARVSEPGPASAAEQMGSRDEPEAGDAPEAELEAEPTEDAATGEVPAEAATQVAPEPSAQAPSLPAAEEEQPAQVAPEAPAETAPPEPVSAPPPLELVEPPPPLPEPVAVVERVVARTVVELPTRGAREWNLWDLERRARERAGEDHARDEEWAALFVNLREYASPDGMLPQEFDELVRESFGELLATERR